MHDRLEFLKRASQAYIVLSPQGYGWECYRHYEAGYVASAPVMNYPTIRRYKPLINGIHGYYYGIEEDELYRLLKQLLENKNGLLTVGKQAREHVFKYHIWEKILQYVLNTALHTT